jgi:6-phosphogluconate dehydrogenase
MTAVEWLFEQLCSEKLSWNKDSNGKLFIDRITSDIFQQAKEMEKEQIIDFGYDIADDLACGKYRDKKAMEERYNEYLTFKQQSVTDETL